MTTGSLLLSLLTAGAGAQVSPDPAGMTIAAAATEDVLLLTTGTDLGLALLEDGSLRVISLAPGAGRNVVASDRQVFFKECRGASQHIVSFDGTRSSVLVEREILCGPFPAPGGFLYSDTEGTHLIGAGMAEAGLWRCAALAPSACIADDGSLWFVDGQGVLSISPDGSGRTRVFGGAATIRACPGLVMARMIDGSARLVDQASRATLLEVEAAGWPVLLDDGSILASRPSSLPGGCGSCVAIDRSGNETPVSPDSVDACRPLLIPGEGPVWTDPGTGEITGPGLQGERIGFRVPESAPFTSGRAPEAEIDVPWMHQRWDSPDWFDGSWSCGPSSCIMAAQYYDRLTPDSIWCSSPAPGHWSGWGRYIPEEFTFLGHTYDIPGLSPGDVWVDGAHGFICRDAGGAYWNYMCLFLEQAGLESGWAGTSWAALTSELQSEQPVVCSSTIYYSGGTYGHIILFAGYFADRTVVVNDPYGDANLTGWGQSWRYPSGKACLYDWPGYNNGHLEIGAVNQLFYARHEIRCEPDTLVDDLSTGFRKLGPCQFWHEEASGWEGGFWWTWATASPPDTCFAKWKPVLPWAGDYEVSVFIPSIYADATGLYRMSTTGGPVTVPLEQGDFSDEWAVLGTFPLQPGDSLYLGDFNGQGGQRIAFDAARFHPLGLSAGPGTAGGGPLLLVANPCRGGIGFTLAGAPPGGGAASVTIRDAAGRIADSCPVAEGVSGGRLGEDLPPGLYFISLVLGPVQVESHRVVILER